MTFPEPGPFRIAEALDQFRLRHPELGEDFDELARCIKGLEVQVDNLRRVLGITDW